MNSFIVDLAREAAGPWTPVVASLLGAVVSPVLTAVIGRSAARAADREKASQKLATERNDQRIRTGDISGSAKFHQTIDQRQYSHTTIHSPATASSSGSDMPTWIFGVLVLSVVVILATAWLGLSLLTALPWACTSGAVILLVMTMRQRLAGAHIPVAAPITALSLVGMCWAVALLVGANDELRQAVTYVQQHGYKVGDPTAGAILWLSVTILFVGLAAVAVQGLTVSARLRDALHPEGKHWTAPFVGRQGFRSWLGAAILSGVLVALALFWPMAKPVLGL
jgi:hypothetical protein